MAAAMEISMYTAGAIVIADVRDTVKEPKKATEGFSHIVLL